MQYWRALVGPLPVPDQMQDEKYLQPLLLLSHGDDNRTGSSALGWVQPRLWAGTLRCLNNIHCPNSSSFPKTTLSCCCCCLSSPTASEIACEPLWQYHCSAIFWLKCKTESCLFLEPLIIGGGRGGRSAFRHTCLSLGLKQENEAVNSNPKKHLHTPGSNFFSSCSGWRN